MKRLLAMVKARLQEVISDRSALAWNLLFAPLLVIGMATVFSGGPQTVATVGVISDAPFTAASHPFLATPAVKFYAESEQDKAIDKVEHQRIDLLLDLRSTPVRYWINSQSSKGSLLQQLLRASDPTAAAQPVSGANIRYADWLVPGLLALNIMFSSLFAIGHVIVRYRKSGYLKRLKGTPLRAIEFISAQLIACLILMVVVSAGIFAACNALLSLRMQGSYLDLLLITVLGSMTMISLSLVISARIASEELSGGLLNLISWPMLVLSGAFFSLDAAPGFVRQIAQIFPLTHMLTAARAVMLDGAGLKDIAVPLLVLSGMTIVFLALGAGMFRWSEE
jgi:ABC-type multidrug transport system permease subunit